MYIDPPAPVEGNFYFNFPEPASIASIDIDFCHVCIKEWALMHNVCPLQKQKMKKIKGI